MRDLSMITTTTSSSRPSAISGRDWGTVPSTSRRCRGRHLSGRQRGSQSDGREVLAPAGLSWGGFTILFVLWVWGERETGQLADDCGLARDSERDAHHIGEERPGRASNPASIRRWATVVVRLLDGGLDTISRCSPSSIVRGQVHRRTRPRRETGSRRLLRQVTATADGAPLIAE